MWDLYLVSWVILVKSCSVGIDIPPQGGLPKTTAFFKALFSLF
jgi:hypothetical protein